MSRQIKLMSNGKGVNEKIDSLHEITAALLNEVKTLKPLKSLEVKNGIDLYREVQEYEIYLIERALEQTGGRQVHAARLLNIKLTTLNCKIKRFEISLARRNSKNGMQTNVDS